jgi:pimeloyl-ACP methyl ester carboxylesterase
MCTGALGSEDGPDLPGPKPEVLSMWAHLGERRDPEDQVAFVVEHWRVLSGADEGGAFDPAEFRALEERIREHSGHDDPVIAHALADPSDLERGDELKNIRTPTLVIDAPLEPVFPPPNAEHLAYAIPGARLVTVPRMGHALPSELVPEIAAAILGHTAPSAGGGRFRHPLGRVGDRHP